jgi:hypothetical protein
MNESNSSQYETNVNKAWTDVGTAVNQATELYVKELSAYLNWAHGLQREVLEQSINVTQEISRLGARQLAFLARIRESVPAYGTVPKGTETVAGMVEAIIHETEPKA